MSTMLSREVSIQAPREKVFAFVSDPMKLPDWVPSLVEVRNISGSGTGQSYDWTYKMVGLPFKGQSEVIAYAPPNKQIHKTKGGIESTWTYELSDQGNATLLKITIDYSVPVPVLQKLAERLVRRRNQRELEVGMAHLKEMLEV